MSRYTQKRSAEVRVENTLMNIERPRRPQFVPRWLKQRVTDAILEGRDKADFQPRSFGCKTYFLPRMTIEVVWINKMPHGLPRELRIWKTTYRLYHRMRDIDRREAFGADDEHRQLANGYKYQWWKPSHQSAEVEAEERFVRQLGYRWS